MAQKNSGHRKLGNEAVVSTIPVSTSRNSKVKAFVPSQQKKGGKNGVNDIVPTIRKPRSIPKRFRTVVKRRGEVITYLLDANVLMHHPHALFMFDEHNVVICPQVWKELDEAKSQSGSEAGCNTRAVVRYLSGIVSGKTPTQLKKGLVLEPPPEIRKELKTKTLSKKAHTGRIFWDFSKPKTDQDDDTQTYLDLSRPDHRILMSCLKLQEQGKKVVLISNDRNFRVVAAHAGIVAEDYMGDVIDILPGAVEKEMKGFHEMPEDFWDIMVEGENCKLDNHGVVTEYVFEHPMFKDVYPNHFLVLPDEKHLLVAEKKGPHQIKAVTFLHHNYDIGVQPRDFSQRLGMELLMKFNLPAVILSGLAGSGKTLFALAAGMSMKEKELVDTIVVTRAAVAVDDIGFLPGTEEEKMGPWLEGFRDNLELLVGNSSTTDQEGDDARKPWATVDHAMQLYNIQFKSLNFMRGRTFFRTFVIVDESQNLTREQVKMVATRLGEGSRIVFLGNNGQIDNRFLTEHTSGLTAVIREFNDHPIVGHVTLQRGERSPFATLAEDRL